MTAPITEAEAIAATDHLIKVWTDNDTEAYVDCFADDASITVYSVPERMHSMAEYRAVYDRWLADGYTVLSSDSRDRIVTLLGDVAVVGHLLTATGRANGEEFTTEERESIVWQRRGERLLVVHEHLSPAPGTEAEQQS